MRRGRPATWSELFYWQTAEYVVSAKACEQDCLTVLSSKLVRSVESDNFRHCYEQANLCWAKSVTTLLRAIFENE